MPAMTQSAPLSVRNMSFKAIEIAAPSLLFNTLLVELVVLLASRASGRQRLLSWMPLLVLIWANLDWHFVIGLVVLLLSLGAVWSNRLGETRYMLASVLHLVFTVRQ